MSSNQDLMRDWLSAQLDIEPVELSIQDMYCRYWSEVLGSPTILSFQDILGGFSEQRSGEVSGVQAIKDYYADSLGIDSSSLSFHDLERLFYSQPPAPPEVFAWLGAPGDSASVAEIEDSTYTNLFPNPLFSTTDEEVVVWENGYRDTIPGDSLEVIDSGREFKLAGVPVPAPHPLGFETCVELGRNPGSDVSPLDSVASVFNLEGSRFDENQTDITYYLWAYSNIPVKIVSAYDSPETLMEADKWVLVDRYGEYSQTAPSTGGEIAFRTVDESPAGDDARVWITGIVTGEPDSPRPPESFTEVFSPDSDLAPKPRPGGGSMLVGQKPKYVEYLAGAENSSVVPVRSFKKLANPAGTSVRLICNKPDLSPQVMLSSPANATSMGFVYSQDEGTGGDGTVATLFNAVDNSAVYAEASSSSDALDNEVITANFEITPSASFALLDGPSVVGKSRYYTWMTVSDDPDYNGPLFNGDGRYPEWPI